MSGSNDEQMGASGTSFSGAGNIGTDAGSSLGSERPSSSERFFCHVCDDAVTNVGEDFTCPRCHSGFLEKIETGAAHGNLEEQDDMAETPAVNMLQNIMEALLQNQAGGIQLQPPQGHVNLQNQQNQGGQPPFMNFMQNLLQNLGNLHVQVRIDGDGAEGMGPLGGFLHGDPGDYAWGPGGLDNIVTQLLNQIEGGVPPMSDDKIKKIPTIEVTQKQVDNKVQCTTCMDEFSLNERVKELPCRHCFHEACIVPWLQRHDTCPICRKSADTSKWNADRTELLSDTNSDRILPQSSNTGRSMMDTIDELD